MQVSIMKERQLHSRWLFSLSTGRRKEPMRSKGSWIKKSMRLKIVFLVVTAGAAGGVLIDYGLSREDALARYMSDPEDDTYFEAIQNASILTSCGSDLMMSADEMRAEKALKKKRNALLLDLGERFPFGSPEAFFAAKEGIEQSEIFIEFRRMPKGAGLHLHLELAGNFTWLCQTLVEDDWWPLFFVDSDGYWYLSPLSRKGLVPASTQLPRNASYLEEQIVVRAQDAWQSPEAWNLFIDIFLRIENVFNYIPFLEIYLTNLLVLFKNEGYQYLELKHSLGNKYTEARMSIADEVLIYEKLADTILPFRIIITGDRGRNAPDVRQTAKEQLVPSRMVTAFDLVNEEDKGHSHYYHSKASLPYALSIDKLLVLHGGETAFAKDTNRVRVNTSYDRDIYAPSRNVMEALRFGAFRVGHNLAAGHDLIALRAYAASKTCAVVNPLSNAILRFQSDLRTHPGRLFCSAQAPFAVSNDDNAALGTNPPTHDIFAIYIAWGLDLAQLKSILLQSLHCSTIALNPSDFEDEWKTWIASIPSSPDDDDDDDEKSLSVWTATDEHEFQRWSALHSKPNTLQCDQGVLVLPEAQCRCFQGFYGPSCDQASASIRTSILPDTLFLFLCILILVFLSLLLLLFRRLYPRCQGHNTVSSTHEKGADVSFVQTSASCQPNSNSIPQSFTSSFFVRQAHKQQQQQKYAIVSSSSSHSSNQNACSPSSSAHHQPQADQQQLC